MLGMVYTEKANKCEGRRAMTSATLSYNRRAWWGVRGGGGMRVHLFWLLTHRVPHTYAK